MLRAATTTSGGLERAHEGTAIDDPHDPLRRAQAQDIGVTVSSRAVTHRSLGRRLLSDNWPPTMNSCRSWMQPPSVTLRKQCWMYARSFRRGMLLTCQGSIGRQRQLACLHVATRHAHNWNRQRGLEDDWLPIDSQGTAAPCASSMAPLGHQCTEDTTYPIAMTMRLDLGNECVHSTKVAQVPTNARRFVSSAMVPNHPPVVVKSVKKVARFPRHR